MLREILDKTAERVGKDLKEQPEVEAELRDTLGWVYYDLGDDLTAEKFHRDALALRRKLYGNEHREVAESLHGLGNALSRQQKLAEAEAAHREALSISRKLFGNDNLDTARDLTDLSLVLFWQDKYVESENMCREALATRRKFLREPHSDIAWSLTILVGPLQEQNKLVEAEALAREALAMRRQLVGNKHPDVALSLWELGDVLAKEGKLTEAEASLSEALAMQRELLVTNHFHLRLTLFDLAQVLACEGKLAESEPLFREWLEPWHKEAEQGNVDSQDAFAWWLATCILPALRDGTAAVSFAEKAVAATNRKEPDYLDTLAAAYAEAGLFPKAVATEKEAIALTSDVKAKEHFTSRLKLYESNTPYRNRGFQ
jgi:tetratricopeptide (TPR) repeat protein